MDRLNRRNVLWTLGCSAAAFVAYPFTGRTALADRDGERRHPRLHAAVVALADARKELQEAPHDFGGHKKAAMEAVDSAVHQLEICRDYH
jgi:hypothetical protein